MFKVRVEWLVSLWVQVKHFDLREFTMSFTVIRIFFLLTRSLSLPHPVLPVVGREIAGVPRVKQGFQEVLKFPVEIF